MSFSWVVDDFSPPSLFLSYTIYKYLTSSPCALPSAFPFSFLCSITRTLPNVSSVSTSSSAMAIAPPNPPATILTPLGYSEVFSSGQYYRNRYISSNASSPINGIAPDLANLAQISTSAPLDNVLMPSAQGFLQGLYPPVGPTLGAKSLRDDRSVEAPLDRYQLIPIQTVTAGTGSEDSAWLQGAGNCANAITSSNAYFPSYPGNQTSVRFLSHNGTPPQPAPLPWRTRCSGSRRRCCAGRSSRPG